MGAIAPCLCVKGCVTSSVVVGCVHWQHQTQVGLKLCNCLPVVLRAALIAEDFGLLQLYAESLQTGGALATYLKSYRAASKRKAKAEGSSAEPVMTPGAASTVIMVTASALAAQVYPDSRFGSLHAKQLTGMQGCGVGLSAGPDGVLTH